MKATIIPAALAAFCLVACGDGPKTQPTPEPSESPTPKVSQTDPATESGPGTSPAENGESGIREDVKHIDNFGDVGPSEKPEDNMVQRPSNGGGPIAMEEVAQDAGVTPQRRSVDHFVRAFSEMVTASAFCSTPFMIDGGEVVETLDKVQNLLDDVSQSGKGASLKVVEFVSFDAATVKDSGSELLIKMMANGGYAKVMEHAKAAGGHFGVLRFGKDEDSDEMTVEAMALVFDKEGKLIGFKD